MKKILDYIMEGHKTMMMRQIRLLVHVSHNMHFCNIGTGTVKSHRLYLHFKMFRWKKTSKMATTIMMTTNRIIIIAITMELLSFSPLGIKAAESSIKKNMFILKKTDCKY